MLNKKFIKFLKLEDEQKRILLNALDFSFDPKDYVIDGIGKKVICPYSNKPVKFQNASILPGSTIIINTSLITLSEYISEYLEPEEFS